MVGRASPRPRHRGWLRTLLALVVVALVSALVVPLALGGELGGLRAQLNDLQYPTGPVDDRLTVVELPLTATDWNRAEHAELIQALADAGVAAIGYDVVFDVERPNDDQLAQAIARSGVVVLAASATLSDEVADGLPQAVAVTRPTQLLADAATGVGNANVLVARLDATVRDVPLVVETGDRRLLPALSLATVMVAEGHDPGAITLRAGSGVAIGQRLVPTDGQRGLEINWALPYDPDAAADADDLTAVSAAEVLAGGVDLDGRIVLVGVVDPLVDVFTTPLDRATTPGVYVQANAANTMLTDLYRSGPDPEQTALVIVALTAALALVGMFARLSLVGVLALVLLVGWQAAVNLAFQTGRNLDNLWPNVAILLATGAVVGARYLTEVRERRRIAGLFRQYVPDRVVDDLLAANQLLAAAEGERREVTVFFCDLRGFTAIAATLAPGDVRAMLEVYYDVATRVLHEHEGTVMQFVGDEVFAVFGAPLPQDDHAQRAVDAAVALQAAAEQINAHLRERGVAIAYGIGLHSGEVVAAHVGSQVHKQYAVVGQTVNVGARLCSLAEPGGIVLSRSVREALDEVPPVELLGEVALKGVDQDPEPARLR